MTGLSLRLEFSLAMTPHRKCPVQLLQNAFVLATAIQCCLAGRLQAEEAGFGHYLIGSYSSSIDFSSNAPGLAVGSDFIFYTGEVAGNRVLPLGGHLAAGLKSDVWLLDVAAAYTFKEEILGAHYTVGIAVPYIWSVAETNSSFSPNLRQLLVNAAGERIGPKAAKLVARQLEDRKLERTLTRKRRDTTSGLSDIVLIPIGLNWTVKDLQITFQSVIYAPTGDFNKDNLVNPGKNYWTFDPILGASYISKKTGTELTVIGGYAMNTVNHATDYLSGSVLHLEATLQQFIPLGSKANLLGIGANGFYYEQVTDDTGSGAVLGALKDKSMGIGPVITFIHTKGTSAVTFQAKWLPEIETRNRLRGDWVWVSLGCKF